MKKIKLLLLLLLPLTVMANLTIKNTPVPGGVAVVDFYTNHSNPKAFYSQVPVYIQHLNDTHWQALIGIPLLAKTGDKQLTIKDFSTRQITFKVGEHAYQEQHITLSGKNKKYVNPNLSHMDRIKQERPILSKARKTFSDASIQESAFMRPVPGVTTSPFGFKRFYNGQARRPHTGLDYAGETGANIKASASGKVIISDEFFFNGNTVFIDHGQGLISVYIHLNKRLVEAGQIVKQGDIIGTIGQTGRATGPHLHFGIYLNQTVINPNLLINNEI
ncbi:peptidoglycan DD-metalloendopeptidase family protein [Candidatus Thioglobus autotrophicus]|uniref:peptidoglycan DD-metalloendopeptidase family protein n=1 Tax=Candidatus Thioglobus autotrophicus TaxID=1705394 RepID=UPI001F36E069|nr:peptidoglycan DD-metalloendopeptidase family protein [Candidatus Thioglobus autotrophicus]